MDQHNLSFEPMDIDVSVHSSNGMDISINESINEMEEFLKKVNDRVKSTPVQAEPKHAPPSNDLPQQPRNIKKFHIDMQNVAVNTHSTGVKYVCIGLVLLLSVFAHHIMNIQCSDAIDVDKLRMSLSYKLYGQNKATDELIEGLSVNERSKILILYGSTGVGKTFAVSTLLEHLGQCSNVYHYTMPSFMESFTTDFMVGLTVCRSSFIIVDDLTPNDVNVKVHISNLLSKTESLEKAVTILLIYNCNPANSFTRQCEESNTNKIMDNLKHIKVYKKMIKFATLTEEHLRKCIETELGHRKITDDEFTKVLKNFDVTIDGCKGVHTKIKLLGIS